MYLSLNWIKKFLQSDLKHTPQELQSLVSTKVAELEGYHDQASAFQNIVIGKIIQLDKHPDADKLTICQVNIGQKEPVQIVCGGTNLELNMFTVVALPDSQVRWHGEGELITLKATKLRGQYSHGMICTSDEIGLGKPKDESYIMNLNHIPKIFAGQNLSQTLNLDDVIFEIDNKSITNRPDLWGHIGFAREIAAITNTTFLQPNLNLLPTQTNPDYSLDVKDKKICKRFSSIILTNLQNPNQELASKIKADLEKLGHKSVNPIVDAINHTMLEYGQPMHAYDFQKIKNLSSNSTPLSLNIEFSKSQTEFEGIDNQTYKLNSSIPILSVNQKPICILGIMGGKNTEVDTTTTEILIESANFTDSTVRKASQILSLRSESSQRFEKSLDPNQTVLALHKAISLLQELYPQSITPSHIQDLYIEKQPDLELNLTSDEINSYLGTQISQTEIQQILQSLSFDTTIQDNKLIISVPSFRASKDISIKQDIIEEVGRIYGYDKIPTKLPNQSSQLAFPNKSKTTENYIRTILKGSGMHETLNYSFYSQKDIENCLIDQDHIQLKNYLSEEQTHMRTSLLPNILKNILHNYKNFPQSYLFELGRVYLPTPDFFPAEEEKIALTYYYNTEDLNQFFQLKSQIENLLNQLQITNYQIQKTANLIPQAHPNISADILDHKNNLLGQIYLVNPKIIDNYNIKNTNVIYAELNLSLLIHEKHTPVVFEELAKYPDMEFDISVVVDHKTTHLELSQALNNISKLIHKVELFDIFSDEEKLGPNKKAMGYKITLRSLERTLTDEDLNQIQKKSYKKLEQIGGIIRGN